MKKFLIKYDKTLEQVKEIYLLVAIPYFLYMMVRACAEQTAFETIPNYGGYDPHWIELVLNGFIALGVFVGVGLYALSAILHWVDKKYFTHR